MFAGLKTKTAATGIVMAVIGVLSFFLPDLSTNLGIQGDPVTLIGTGLGFIFARMGIAKNGNGS